MEEEIWKLYKDSRTDNKRNTSGAKWEVSSYGRVKRNDILYIIKLKNPKYYYRITTKFLHRIIAELFIPNPDNKPCIDHIDGDIHNNHVNNLHWVTQRENLNNPIARERQRKSHLGKSVNKGNKRPDLSNNNKQRKGSKYMTNDIKGCYVQPKDFTKYLNNGYHFKQKNINL